MPDVFSHGNSSTQKHAKDSIDELKHENLSFFSTFVELPNKVHFENQESNETILIFLRRHPITNLPWLLLTALFSLLPILLPFLFPVFIDTLFTTAIELPANYLTILILLYYLIVIGYGLFNFASWFYNISIVTNNEVVDIDYSHVTYKNIATTNLREIQDVEYVQRGFFQTFFDYGDVFVQTAGSHPNLEFLRVPHPAKVNDIILDEKRRVVGHG